MNLPFSRLLAAVAVCTVMAGCDSQNSAAPTTNDASKPAVASESQTVSVVSNSHLPADAPILNVVTVGKTKPFSFTEADGSVTGLDIDIMTKVAETQGFKVQFHKKPWIQLFQLVDAGQYDLAISGISYTDERAEKYALSDSYAVNPSIIMFADTSLQDKIKGLNNLADLRVGVLDGSKHAKQMANLPKKELRTYNSTYLLFTSLLKGETDAILQDGLLLQQMAKDYPQRKMYSVAYESDTEPSAQLVILMKKDNTDLQGKINAGLKQAKEDGSLAKIQEKWIGTAK